MKTKTTQEIEQKIWDSIVSWYDCGTSNATDNINRGLNELIKQATLSQRKKDVKEFIEKIDNKNYKTTFGKKRDKEIVDNLNKLDKRTFNDVSGWVALNIGCVLKDLKQSYEQEIKNEKQ